MGDAPLSKRHGVNFGAAEEDRISYLPGELITCILKRLPIHDVARTSLLSKAWRNIWAMHPNLILNRQFDLQLTSKKERSTHESELIKAFNMILSSHTGPILYFYLYITPVLRHKFINQWIKQLSDKGLKSIYLFIPHDVYLTPPALVGCLPPKEFYSLPPAGPVGRLLQKGLLQKMVYSLPSALFDCPDLNHLTLYNWVMAGPSSIKAGSFSNLKKVELNKTSIAQDMTFGTQLEVLLLRNCRGIEHLTPQFRCSNNLQRLSFVSSTKIEWQWFQSTTKLKYLGLVLMASNSNMKGVNKLIELLSKIPTFSNLEIYGITLEVLGPPPSDLTRPTTKAVQLRSFKVHQLKIYKLCHILNVVYLIRSFPNLHDLCIELAPDPEKNLNLVESRIEHHVVSLDWKDMCLDRLQTVKMKGVVHSKYLLHFIKALLASSPSLKVITLFCSKEINDPEEKLRIKRDLQQFPILSLDAQVIWC